MFCLRSCLLISLCSLITQIEAAEQITSPKGVRILMLSVFEPRSHRNVFMPLAKELVAHGHDVTLIGMYEPKDGERIRGVHEITVPVIGKLYQSLAAEIFNLTRRSKYGYFSELTAFNRIAADTFLDSDIAKELYNNPNSYDVVIVNGLVNEYSYPLAKRVAPITILLLPCDMLPWIADIMGLPTPFSYLPVTILKIPTVMSFWQRLYSSILSSTSLVAGPMLVHSTYNDKVQQRFPGLPSIQEVEKQISLTLVNTEPGLSTPRPAVPAVVEVGCMHCRPAQRLTGELAEYLDDIGEEGFILFSLGSVLKASVLPSELKIIFVKVFSRLKQKVIWKYEEELKDLPENVKIVKWLPQQDILGHPKIRLFITHSGLLSLQEAVYHGVPVLGIPVFADQPGNIARILERHMGESIDLHIITENIVLDKIETILSDASYMTAANKYSSVTRDQLQRPTDRAVFWIEYVLRHEGAPHLRTQTQHLNFFQYFLLDVVAFFLLSAVIGIYLLVKTAQFVLYICPCITDSY